MLTDNNNIWNLFIYYKKEKYRLCYKEQDNKKDKNNLINKNTVNKSIKDMFYRYICQDEILANELLASLKK